MVDKISVRRTITAVVVAALAAALCLCATGCSSVKATLSNTKTLEEYFDKHPDELNAIKADISDMENDVVSAKISVSGNRMIVTLTMSGVKSTDPSSTISEFKSIANDSLQSLEGSNRASVKEMEKAAGITGIVMEFRINTADGKTLASKTYSA